LNAPFRCPPHNHFLLLGCTDESTGARAGGHPLLCYTPWVGGWVIQAAGLGAVENRNILFLLGIKW
jgi:hypothetical protein